MSTIQWQPAASHSAGEARHVSRPASAKAAGYDIWFSISLSLIGFIVGFGAAKWQRAEILVAPQPIPQAAVAARAPAAPSPSPQNPPSAAPGALAVPSVDFAKDHIRGSKDATLAVIEYSDFECPFCKRVHPTYQQIMQQYDGKVLWVYRHFPLSFHKNSEQEAEASECAGELGGNEAFWKFTDGIFEKTTSNGTGFPLDQLPVLAKQIGLDEAKFQACLSSGKYATLVKKEADDGSAGGVTGTPGNYVVDLKTNKATEVQGAQPFSSFKSAIDAFLP